MINHRTHLVILLKRTNGYVICMTSLKHNYMININLYKQNENIFILHTQWVFNSSRVFCVIGFDVDFIGCITLSPLSHMQLQQAPENFDPYTFLWITFFWWIYRCHCGDLADLLLIGDGEGNTSMALIQISPPSIFSLGISQRQGVCNSTSEYQSQTTNC